MPFAAWGQARVYLQRAMHKAIKPQIKLLLGFITPDRDIEMRANPDLQHLIAPVSCRCLLATGLILKADGLALLNGARHQAQARQVILLNIWQVQIEAGYGVAVG